MTPDAGDRGAQRLEPARPRRRLLPDRPQVRASCRSRTRSRSRTTSSINADESEPGTFKRPRDHAARPVPVPRGLPRSRAHAIESTARLHLHPRRVRGRSSRSLRRRARADARRAGLLGDVTIVLHRGAGAYICGEETALLESLEGKRGQPRTKPPFPAIAGALRLADGRQQRRVDHDRDRRSLEHRRRRVREARRRELDRHARLLALGQRRQRRQLRAAARLTLRELIYDLGGGIPDGRELKAVIPGGSSTVILTADEVDTRTLDFDSLVGAGTAIGSAARDRDRRPLLHGAARPCRRLAVLRARVVRQVHAVPRVGTQLADRRSSEKIEDGRGAQADLDSRCVASRARSTASASARSATRTRSPVASYVDKFRDEFQAHIDEGGCPFHGDVVASTSVSRRSPCTTHAPRSGQVPGVSAPSSSPSRSTTARSRCRRAPGSSRRLRRGRDRDPRLLLRAAARPPVGACRMCLVEVEGAAEAPGRLHARPRRTAWSSRPRQTSAKAAEGQNATLEFILVNHPLDCPVCDKGGECPLQDLDVPLRAGHDAHDVPEAHARASRSRSRR